MDKDERKIITEKNIIEHIETTTNGKMTHNHLLQMNTRFRGIVAIFSILVYMLLFCFLYYSYGQAMAMSATIPVIVIGYLYGFVPGICAAALSLPANIFMYELVGINGLESMILAGGGIPGTLTLVLFGGIVGRIRDLSINLKRELYERKKVEKELKGHRDKLSEMVKQKTKDLQESNKRLKKEIKEREWTNEELEETKDSLDNIINSSLDCIMVSDRTGNITRVNKYFLDLLGYKEEEVLGKHVMECTPMAEEGTFECTTGELLKIGKDFVDDASKKIAKLIDEGKVINWETFYFRNDKKVVPIEQNIVCLYNKEGERTGAVAIIRDITERKKAEKEIREAKEFFENTFNTSADGIMVTNTQGEIVKVNKAIEQMLGYQAEEIIGKHTVELSSRDEKYVKSNISMLEQLYEKSFVKNWETEWFRKDGSSCPTEVNITQLRDLEGNPVGSVAAIRDISGKKKMEQQLLQSEKLKSLGELSGGVAHDFNNVLAAILGRVQLMKIQLKPPHGEQEKRKSILNLKAGLEIIEKASLDGAETVRRIQEFSRRRADDKNFTQVNINELADNALEFTKTKWKNEAEAKGIKINIEKEYSPLSPILGSSSEIREIFTNLINNAVDAMPQGGEIRVKSFMDDTNSVISIGDTGRGIPKDITDRVFDPFFTTKGVRSTGLGLSVSYGIVKRHKGTITIDSVEGEGTNFTIKFPVAKKTGKKNVKKEKIIPLKSKQRKARILVIEDEEDVRHLLRDILTDAGHEVEVATNGSEGIEIFEKKEFDLVLTDLGMPVMSGWEVAEKVKCINGKVPVALITGWNVKLDESEMNDSRINLVVQKPFKMEQILNLVQEGMLLRDQLKAV